MKSPSSLPQQTAIRRLPARSRARREGGSTLIVALVTLVVLALIAASTFLTVTNRFRSNYQTASWHDALTSAEDGAQYAMVRLRSTLTKVTPPNQSSSTDPVSMLYNQALTNPLQIPGSLQSDLSPQNANTTSVNGTLSTYVYGGKTYPRVQLPTLSIPHTGDGSRLFSATVTVDALPDTGTDNPASTWYRIRSTGTVPLTGGAKVGIQKYDNLLRKLQFYADGAGHTVTSPRAVRTIEVIAKPVFIGNAALFGKTGINLNNQNVVIDSYNSTDPNASSNGTTVNGTYQYGQYDPTKATQQANVVTNDAPTGNGTPGVINLNNGAYVNGNIATNDTPVQGSTDHVSGTVTEDFYQNLPNPPDPTTMNLTWTPYDPNSKATPTDSSGNLLMSAGTQASPARYKIAGTGDLTLNNQNLIVTDAAGGGYVEIWIPGGLDVEGNNQITVPAGTHVTFYVDGNVKIAGNGVLNSSEVAGNPNPSYIPGDLIFYGNPDPTVNQTITVNGNGIFAGIIYAPNASVTAKGSGNNGDIFGAIIAHDIFFNGTTSLHYDTALGSQGAVFDYSIASWYEDNALTR